MIPTYHLATETSAIVVWPDGQPPHMLLADHEDFAIASRLIRQENWDQLHRLLNHQGYVRLEVGPLKVTPKQVFWHGDQQDTSPTEVLRWFYQHPKASWPHLIRYIEVVTKHRRHRSVTQAVQNRPFITPRGEVIFLLDVDSYGRSYHNYEYPRAAELLITTPGGTAPRGMYHPSYHYDMTTHSTHWLSVCEIEDITDPSLNGKLWVKKATVVGTLDARYKGFAFWLEVLGIHLNEYGHEDFLTALEMIPRHYVSYDLARVEEFTPSDILNLSSSFLDNWVDREKAVLSRYLPLALAAGV